MQQVVPGWQKLHTSAQCRLGFLDRFLRDVKVLEFVLQVGDLGDDIVKFTFIFSALRSILQIINVLTHFMQSFVKNLDLGLDFSSAMLHSSVREVSLFAKFALFFTTASSPVKSDVIPITLSLSMLYRAWSYLIILSSLTTCSMSLCLTVDLSLSVTSTHLFSILSC